jgi:hypothetical protein
MSSEPRLAPPAGRPREGRGGAAGTAADPFLALGLEPRADLTDGEVHAAWRRTASATHPDREDGGDLWRFADAAAAYTVLRTRFGRGEALADLQVAPPASRLGWLRPARLALRVALRVAVAVAASLAAVAAAGPHPAAPALVTGIATWLVLTARRDLGPRGPR